MNAVESFVLNSIASGWAVSLELTDIKEAVKFYRGKGFVKLTFSLKRKQHNRMMNLLWSLISVSPAAGKLQKEKKSEGGKVFL